MTDFSSQPQESLAQARSRILAMFRTRRELVRWSAVTDYANVADAGVGQLQRAAERFGAAALISTAQKAIAIVEKLLHYADDSNGEIQDVLAELLALHAALCNAQPPKPAALVNWLVDFTFDSDNFFQPDIADYTDALGPVGLRLLTERLDAVEAALPPATDRWDSERSALERYRERLAIAIGDPAGVIASFGDLTRSYRMHDLAKALVEVGAIDEAVAYAERATMAESEWHAERAGRYWADLLHEHRPQAEELAARKLVFDRWPSSVNALALARAAGPAWESLAEPAFVKLEGRHPRELIDTLLSLGLVDRAWHDAERLTTDTQIWTRLVALRAKSDPASIVPVLIRLIDADLEVSHPRNYTSAVKRLKQLRTAMKTTDETARFAGIVAELREQHRRRPRLLEEMTRAGF